MRDGVRHSLKLAARVGKLYSFAFKLLLGLHHFLIHAYSLITPPCFYSPGNQFHVSLGDEMEAIAISLRLEQKRIIRLRQQKRKRNKLLLISFALLLLAYKQHQHDARASSDTTNLGISASIAPKCKIYSTSMAFGTYDPQNNSNLDVNGEVLISCTKNTSATIAMDAGTNTSHAQGSTRSMHNTSGGNGNSSYISYELYKNSGRSNVWSIASPLAITATTAAQVAIPIYGRITQGQNVQDGEYLDTVIVTVNF